jgi:transposase-like protein
VFEQRTAHPSERAALQTVATTLGTTAETVRTWARHPERDPGHRMGLTRSARERLTVLERENRERKRPNELLKTASASVDQSVLDRRTRSARWWRSSRPVGIASGSSRTAERCRSPPRHLTAITSTTPNPHVDRRVPVATTRSVLPFNGPRTSITRSTAGTHCGFR